MLRGGPWCSGRGVKIWGEVGTARIDTLSRRSHAGQERSRAPRGGGCGLRDTSALCKVFRWIRRRGEAEEL